jgi:hypothetical protein
VHDPEPVPPDEPGPSHPRLTLTGEYLLWWQRRDQVPPLATTSSPADLGILGNPTTQILFGGDGLGREPRSGGRFTADYWFDLGCKEVAVELGGFFLGQEAVRFNASSAMFPVLARPFFNLNMNEEFSELVAFPGTSTGNLDIRAPSRLWGGEANLRCKLCCGCDYRVDLLGGFRYLDLEESIRITENIQGLPTAPSPIFANQRITVFDEFATRNQFYGGQVGVAGQYRLGGWTVDGTFKLALGGTHQTIDISGGQTFVAPDGTVRTAVGGLLALPTNIGHFSRDRVSVVPEVGVNLGYQLTDHLRAYVGYNFLYWDRVVRPGAQIDRMLDVTQIPNFPVPGAVPTGQSRPLVPFKETDFWAQGLTFGLEFRW